MRCEAYVIAACRPWVGTGRFIPLVPGSLFLRGLQTLPSEGY